MDKLLFKITLYVNLAISFAVLILRFYIPQRLPNLIVPFSHSFGFLVDQVSDTSVRTAVMRACGLRATQVRRHVYKGVDTGERLVRVAPPCMSYARLQAAAGSSGTIITEAVADCSIVSAQFSRPWTIFD